MAERVEHDILEASFVGEPLDMFEDLTRDRSVAFFIRIGSFSVDEYDNRFGNRVIDISIENLRKSL